MSSTEPDGDVTPALGAALAADGGKVIDRRLIDALRNLGDEWGPLGVAIAAARFTDRDALIRCTDPRRGRQLHEDGSSEAVSQDVAPALGAALAGPPDLLEALHAACVRLERAKAAAAAAEVKLAAVREFCDGILSKTVGGLVVSPVDGTETAAGILDILNRTETTP